MRPAVITALAVGAGGFVGALARYGLSGLAHRVFPLMRFPLGTLLVNLAGCFAIGLLAGFTDSRQLFRPSFRAFAMVGLLGSFTTFSTFGYETVAMLRDAEYLRAGANAGAQLVVGVALVWLGYTAATLR